MIATSKPLSSAQPDSERMAATRSAVPEGPGFGLTMKIALAGDPGVGKSSLVRRFVSDTFDDQYVSTLGTKVSSRKFRVDDPRHVGASIEVGASVWDVMGSLGFRELLKDAFFSNTQAVLYVCDRTRPESLWSLLDWAAAVESVAGPTPTSSAARAAGVPSTRARRPARTWRRRFASSRRRTSFGSRRNSRDAPKGLFRGW